MVNKIKNQGKYPDYLLFEDIFSIYKGKGDRSSFESDRGIFILSVVRMILDKMNFNDLKETIDQNISDSQIGGRPNKNIRNHLFILYSITDLVKQGKAKPIDIQAYDVKKCFDALKLKEKIK